MQSTKVTATDTTYVSQAENNKNFYYADPLKIGETRFSCGENDALLKFRTVSLLPPACSIVSAKMHICVNSIFGEADGCCPGRIGIFRNLEDFNARTANWQNRPRTEKIPGYVFYFTGGETDYVFCDITGLVAYWCKDPQTNFGITLRANRAQKQLIRVSSMHSQSPPYLSVEYYADQHSSEHIDSVFVEHVFDIEGDGEESFSPPVDLSAAQTATFFIKNISDSALKVNIQISPDGDEYIDDAQTMIVPTGDMGSLTPYYFAKFDRVRLSGDPGVLIAAKIWCQIQTRNYYMY